MIKNCKDALKKHIGFVAICSFFAIYYCYRLVTITPWYDELYTYIKFIDKGVVYSMTHWPAPNNHIFFSMASAVINIVGKYIGLRGISYLAAMGTLILIYVLLQRMFSMGTAMFSVMAYGMLNSVNFMAVQGRGYSLATFFFALSVFSGYHICYKEDKKRYYVFWILALYLGLYTLMSSIYWVVAVCVCCGILLLLFKKGRTLIKLIGSSLIAAFLTLLSYSVMWLGMGAERLIATEYPGASAVSVAIRHPRACLLWGINFMRDDRNLQSIDRGAFVHDFKYFARDILNTFINIRNLQAYYIFVTIIIIMVAAFVGIVIVSKKKKTDLTAMPILYSLIFSGIGFVCVYICLFVQSVYPFSRVFSFLGVLFCMLFGTVIGAVETIVRKRIDLGGKRKWLPIMLNIPMFIACIFVLCSYKYNLEYEDRDYYALDAVRQVKWEEGQSYLAGDVYVRQQIVFHQEMIEDKELVESLDRPDVIIISRAGATGMWPDVISAEEYNALQIQERELIYENELYYVYR